MNRLPLLDPGSLDDEQRSLFEAIVGRRADGPQHFRLQHNDGTLTGPFNAMLYAPGVCGPLSRLGEVIRYDTVLGARHREIAVLTVAAARRSGYEWYAHERVGRAAGLTDDELTAIRDRDSTGFAHGADATVHRAASALASRQPLDDELFVEATAALGTRALVELVVLVGYYELLATMLDAFAVGVPEGEEPFS